MLKKFILKSAFLLVCVFFQNLYASTGDFKNSVIKNLINKNQEFTITYNGDAALLNTELKTLLNIAITRAQKKNVIVRSWRTSMSYSAGQARVTFMVTYRHTPENTCRTEQQLTDYIYKLLQSSASEFQVGFFSDGGQNPGDIAAKALKRAGIKLEQETKNLNIASSWFKIISYEHFSEISFSVTYIPRSKLSEKHCQTEQELTNLIHINMEQRNPDFIIHFLGNVSGKAADPQKALETASSKSEYLKNSIKSTSFQSLTFNKSQLIEFNISYLTDIEQEKTVDKITDEILAGIISMDMDIFQKEKAIHDYIILNVAYDESKTYNSAYDALVRNTTVCKGYSLLAQKLFDKAGIASVIVNSEEMEHSWNMVYIEGNWYHLDITWDDPVPDKKGRIIYSYYNLTDREMLNHPKRNHTWDHDKYPKSYK